MQDALLVLDEDVVEQSRGDERSGGQPSVAQR
jgi:hypothetical protein